MGNIPTITRVVGKHGQSANLISEAAGHVCEHCGATIPAAPHYGNRSRAPLRYWCPRCWPVGVHLLGRQVK